jgi:hypothetical protein
MPGYEPASCNVGFVVYKAALGEVFSGYFNFPCHSFHRLRHTHHNNHLGAGTIGQIGAHIPSGLSQPPPPPPNRKYPTTGGRVITEIHKSVCCKYMISLILGNSRVQVSTEFLVFNFVYVAFPVRRVYGEKYLLHFSLFHIDQTGCGAHSDAYSVVEGPSFPGG